MALKVGETADPLNRADRFRVPARDPDETGEERVNAIQSKKMDVGQMILPKHSPTTAHFEAKASPLQTGKQKVLAGLRRNKAMLGVRALAGWQADTRYSNSALRVTFDYSSGAKDAERSKKRMTHAHETKTFKMDFTEDRKKTYFRGDSVAPGSRKGFEVQKYRDKERPTTLICGDVEEFSAGMDPRVLAQMTDDKGNLDLSALSKYATARHKHDKEGPGGILLGKNGKPKVVKTIQARSMMKAKGEIMERCKTKWQIVYTIWDLDKCDLTRVQERLFADYEKQKNTDELFRKKGPQRPFEYVLRSRDILGWHRLNKHCRDYFQKLILDDRKRRHTTVKHIA